MGEIAVSAPRFQRPFMVGAIHPKAMPVILSTAYEVEIWMNAAWDEAKMLQRKLRDGSLQIVARGVKEDTVAPVA